MRVLVACEYSGTVRDAFRAKGHDAWSCDLLPTDVPGPHIQGDVTAVLEQGWDLIWLFITIALLMYMRLMDMVRCCWQAPR